MNQLVALPSAPAFWLSPVSRTRHANMARVRDARTTKKGGPRSLSQCGCRPGLRWSIMRG
eukprot:1369125-Prymnesium_polylepis.1